MDGEIIVEYVRGTCRASKASFLLQLYLLNLIRARSKAVINFHKCLDIVLAFMDAASIIPSTMTNFKWKFYRKKKKNKKDPMELLLQI